jgi:peptidoglycan hydrolase-like protein with peptidoglycan-binding domain
MADLIFRIPENITVHLGKPEEAADNITVPYLDYIINVASSSLNPNLPESVLTANIYCIISHALNRIFNNYYRSAGYGFDITSAEEPGYNYTDGHAVFNNIADIAGGICNSYLVRGGSSEPLREDNAGIYNKLNGTQAADAAEQGINHIDILKKIFGDDIDIATDAPSGDPEESPLVFPAGLGSSGRNIWNLQMQLNRISANYPAIPKIFHTDGIYSYYTQAAVEEFQKIFGLKKSGVLDRATWHAVKKVYNAVNRLNLLDSAGMQLGMSTQQFPEELTVGSSGAGVTNLKYYINFLSQYYKSVPQVSKDGFFSEETLAALEDIQRALGLKPSGVLDKVTWERMYDAYLGIVETIPEEYARSVILPFPGTEQRLGMGGDAVRIIQDYINYISEAYPEIPHVPPTGYYGPRMQEAVIALQKLLGLRYNGITDEQTWNAVADLYSNLYKDSYLNEGQYPGFDISVETDYGSGESVAIRQIQKCLNEISKKGGHIQRVPVDGIYGDSTRQSVAEFQREAGLDPTGVVDRETWDMLFDTYFNEKGRSNVFSSPHMFPSNPAGYEVKSGDSSFLVSFIQYLLQEISRDYDFTPAVTITGTYDGASEKAVGMFQEKNMMPVTGRVDAATLARIIDCFNIIQNEYSQ